MALCFAYEKQRPGVLVICFVVRLFDSAGVIALPSQACQITTKLIVAVVDTTKLYT